MPDASLLVALDGHIENAAELAAELSVRAGDLPGLVRACLAAWGEDFVGRLQGAFALVMVEPALGLVRLARDPLGVRPLYWARAGVGTLAFASLPCALTAVPGIGFEPDLQALRRELLGMPIISPATCYREIAMVPRGTLLRFEQLQPRSRPYWAPHAPSAVDEAEWVERYRRAFRRSTEGKLQGAPRPVGVTLSGGIDSSCVLGMARSLVTDPSELVAVTASLTGAAAGDEPFAAEVARYCGVPRRRFEPAGGALPERDLRLAADPYVAAQAGLILEVASVARASGCRVLLTGSVGDFIGGSLPGWRSTLLHRGGPARLWQELSSDPRLAPPRRLRTWLGSLLSYGVAMGWLPTGLVPLYRARLRDSRRALDLLAASRAEKRRLVQQTAEYLRDRELPRTDMASLARAYMDSASDQELCLLDLVSRISGVELRAPLADAALMDIFVGLPWGLRRKRGMGRIALRESVRGLVPDSLRRRATKLQPSDDFARLRRAAVQEALKRPSMGPAAWLDSAAWHRRAVNCANLSRRELRVLYETLVVARWLEGQVAPFGREK